MEELTLSDNNNKPLNHNIFGSEVPLKKAEPGSFLYYLQDLSTNSTYGVLSQYSNGVKVRTLRGTMTRSVLLNRHISIGLRNKDWDISKKMFINRI